MGERRITKRVVDQLTKRTSEYAVWDAQLPGFGVRVRPTGAQSYVVVYRAGAGRGAPVRRYTIAGVGKITPEAAITRAKAILGAVAHGHDPAGEKAIERGALTIAELAERFMTEHVEQKRDGNQSDRLPGELCTRKPASRKQATGATGEHQQKDHNGERVGRVPQEENKTLNERDLH